MAARHGIYHNNSLPSEVGGNWAKLGENVGRGSSVSQVHNAFMDSSTHRVHILDSAYNQIGVGVFRGSDGYVYVTEVFAARGSTHVVHKAVIHHVQSVFAPALHRARPAVHKVVAPAVTPPQTIEILMDLLALDAPTPARKYIPTNRPPP